MDQLLAFYLAHQAAVTTAGGALFASLLHAKFHGKSLSAKALGLALPGFLNGPLAKQVAVDVAKTIIAKWDKPAAPPTNLPG